MSSAGELIRLETRGRTSGKPHDVLVRFIAVDGKIVVFPQIAGGQDWVENIKRTPGVRIFSQGKTIDGSARLRDVSGLGDPLLKIFQRKYGETEVRKRYWGQTRYVEIEILSQASNDDYLDLLYADLEAAFDGVADDYDRHIFGNEMNLWLRNRSVDHLTKTFRAGDLVLEIGCGTGTETLALAKRGIKVVASDLSSKMLKVLERHARDEGLSDLVVPVHARPYQLKEKLKALGIASVDGAYSTYGAINTEPRLDLLFEDLHAMIRPGGRLLLGVWNKFCLYEMVGYSVRMKPRMIVARLRNPVPVGRSRFCISSMAYTVGSLDKIIADRFELEELFGVEILLPPSNLTEYLPPKPLLELVKRVEVGIEGKFPWNRLGDHFLGVYARVG